MFIHTNYFRHDQPQYASGTSQILLFPTSFTPTLIEAARDCVRRVYQQGYQFKKAGSRHYNITPQDVLQPDLFSQFSFSLHEKQRRLMDVVDDLNLHYGRDTVYYAAMGIERTWQMKQTRKSPHYTTRWEDKQFNPLVSDLLFQDTKQCSDTYRFVNDCQRRERV